MTRLAYALAALAFTVLAAHLYRAGHVLAAIAALAAMALLAVHRPWSRRALQGLLVLGALEWLRALAALVAARASMGAPYARLAIILGAVALLTAAAAAMLETPALRARFARARDDATR